mmetsp:Transcript_59355/g.88125  ORF Transcript_59355/g.88125 Transcript_59355/m.88125 type:complete len:437 (+) Transcript_59355:227-1537(+)
MLRLPASSSLIAIALLMTSTSPTSAFQHLPMYQPPSTVKDGGHKIEVLDASLLTSSTSQYDRTVSSLQSSPRINTKGSHFLDFVLLEKEVDDIIWSLFSNFFFVFGGLFYLYGSLWDWDLAVQLAAAQREHFVSSDTTDPTVVFEQLGQSAYWYHAIWILGPTVYLFNSFIDVTWASITMKREKQIRGMKQFYRAANEHAASVSQDGDSSSDIMMALEKFYQHVREESFDGDLFEGAMMCGTTPCLGTSESMEEHKKVLLRRIRTHFGHRRELSSATAFGAAAIFGVWSAVGDASSKMDATMVTLLDSVSIHLYLLSAIFALCGRTQRPHQQENDDHRTKTPLSFLEDAEALEDLGDVFFGVASIVDVVLCDFTFDDNTPWWPVVSAVFWIIDALLYLRGDFVVLYRDKKLDGTTVTTAASASMGADFVSMEQDVI